MTVVDAILSGTLRAYRKGRSRETTLELQKLQRAGIVYRHRGTWKVK